jgi:hypothetical protein
MNEQRMEGEKEIKEQERTRKRKDTTRIIEKTKK